MIQFRTGIASQYLFSDGIVLYDKPVGQTTVLGKFPLGIMAGMWHTTGYDAAFRHDSGDEFAFGAGWHVHENDIELEVGVKQHLNAGPRGSTLIPEIEIGWMILKNLRHEVEPYINMEALVSRGRAATELSFGTHHNWFLPSGASLSQRLAVQLNSATHGLESTTLLTYRASLGWKLVKRETFTVRLLGPWVRLYAPLTDTAGYSFVQTYGLGAEIEWHL